MRHVLEHIACHQVGSFTKQIGNNRKAVTKDIDNKTICLKNSDYQRTNAKSCHSRKITEP